MPSTTLGFARGPLVDEKGNASRDFVKKLQEWDGKLNSAITLIGQIAASTKIQGRSEGIGTTASQLNNTGQLLSADQVAADGSTYLRSPQFAGTAINVENGNFEASAVLPPPGWFAGAGPTLSYDTATPYAGLRSLKVNFTAQFQAVSTVRKWACRPGDAFRLSLRIKSDGVSQIYAQVTFLDASGAFLSSGNTNIVTAAAWTFAQATMVAPANSVGAVVWLTNNTVGASMGEYDEINVTRNLTAFELTPINTSASATNAAGCLSQSGVSATINVASRTFQYGDGAITYSAGSVTPGGGLGTYYVYADDPAFLGGAVTYQASPNQSDVYGGNGRIFFGKITTAGGGGGASVYAGGTGGGRLALL